MNIVSPVLWRIQRVLRVFGVPGLCGLVLIGVGIAVHFFLLVPMRDEISGLKNDARLLRVRSKLPATMSKVLNPAEQLADFYRFFPLQETVPDGMAKIYAAAAAQGVVLDRGDYQLARERDSNLLRYDIVFPVKGAYLQIRKFVAQVLNEVPNASLEGIVFTRQRINEPVIDAELRFALYLRAQR